MKTQHPKFPVRESMRKRTDLSTLSALLPPPKVTLRLLWTAYKKVRRKGVKKSMILALSITLAVLAVLALGILAYFKFFALVYDKDGMVYQAQGGPHLCNPPHIEDDDPIDGGATDNSDTNAPKSIESTQIISFNCRFSTMDIAEPGKTGNHIYQLQAKLENGAVKGMYQIGRASCRERV